MSKTFNNHKRNTSETFKGLEAPPKSTNSINFKKIKNVTDKNKPNTMSLVEKSGKRVANKHTIIEHLNQTDDGPQPPFFAFGHGAGGQRNWHLNLDKISQVQDSNSRREYTSHRSARETINYNKENIHTSNIDDNSRISKKSKGNTVKIRSKQKDKNNKSRNQRTKSTISLSRTKHSKDLEVKTDKMQKSVKMLWECMGQLWQNSRVCQYKSQKNGQSISLLKRKLEEHEQKIMDMKFEISKMEKQNEKTKLGFRA